MCISASQESRGGSMAVIRIGVSLDGCRLHGVTRKSQELETILDHVPVAALRPCISAVPTTMVSSSIRRLVI